MIGREPITTQYAAGELREQRGATAAGAAAAQGSGGLRPSNRVVAMNYLQSGSEGRDRQRYTYVDPIPRICSHAHLNTVRDTPLDALGEQELIGRRGP